MIDQKTYEKLWKTQLADSLRWGIVEFTKLANPCEVARSLDIQILVYNGPKFFGAEWNRFTRQQVKFELLPVLKKMGRIFLIRPNSEQFFIQIFPSEFYPDNYPYRELVDGISDEFTPDEFRYPRAKDFDYQRKDWKKWILFGGFLKIEIRPYELGEEFNPNGRGSFIKSPNSWMLLFNEHLLNIVPLDRKDILRDLYNDLGLNEVK